VTPLSLGIETLGRVFTALIERNTTVPTKKTEIFSTASDNQPSVEIHVLQGERKMADQNKTIGRFHLDGIPPASRGVPQIEVTFDVDANGILHVSAKDLGTGREQKITITASSGLSDAEIKEMVKDAEDHADEDKKNRETAETRNMGDNLVYQTEKLIKDQGAKMTDDKKKPVEDELAKLKEALKGSDNEAIKTAIEGVNSVMQAFTADMYAQAKSNRPAGEAGGAEHPGAEEGAKGKGGKDDVIDADFEMVDENKKK
jgi:molecular chaperone DnaK